MTELIVWVVCGFQAGRMTPDLSTLPHPIRSLVASLLRKPFLAFNVNKRR
jgi:hypothetical protein